MAQLLGLAQFSTSCLLTCQFKEQQRISNQSPILPNICQVYTNLSRSESICDDDRKTMRKNSQHTSLANEVCQNFDSVLVLPHYTLYDTACRVLSYYRRWNSVVVLPTRHRQTYSLRQSGWKVGWNWSEHQDRRDAMMTTKTTTSTTTALFRFYFLVCRVFWKCLSMDGGEAGCGEGQHDVVYVLCVVRQLLGHPLRMKMLAGSWLLFATSPPIPKMPHTYFITWSTDVMDAPLDMKVASKSRTKQNYLYDNKVEKCIPRKKPYRDSADARLINTNKLWKSIFISLFEFFSTSPAWEYRVAFIYWFRRRSEL